MTRGKRIALITMRIALILAIILILLVVVFVLLLLRKSYYTEWAEAEQESIWVSEEPKMYFKFKSFLFIHWKRFRSKLKNLFKAFLNLN